MGSVAANGNGEPSSAALQQEKPVRIGNAGLVLLSPYLPTLFDRSGLLVRPATRVAEADIPRALRLLDHLAYGAAQPPQSERQLNGILCGIPFSRPSGASPDLNEGDSSLCDSLITAVISNWTALGHISPAGLRETFLQRQGVLGREGDHFRLTVERKALDVLVERVPWSFSTIKHGWMPDLLQVVW